MNSELRIMPKKTENYLPEPEETHYEDVLSGLHPFEGGTDWDYKHNKKPTPKNPTKPKNI